MKLYVSGCESDQRVRLLIKLTKISSTNVIAALRAHLVKGWHEELAAYTYDVDLSNLKRALKRINDVIDLHNQLSDLNCKDTTGLSTKQLKVKKSIISCNHSVSDIARQSGVSERSIYGWATGNNEPRDITPVLEAVKYLNMGQ